jgi:hypothetical protein
MAKKYKYRVCTRELSRQECKNCLDEIIDILRVHQVLQIEMMFGLAWDNEHKEWIPFIVPPDEITLEIEKAEQTGIGNFYNADTFLTLHELNSEILFCHEFDIHLEFDEINNVVNDIIEAWGSRDIIQGK